MDVIEAIHKRKSIRAFLPKPVPRELLEKVLDSARWAPSWANTQPWEFLVIGGETLIRIGREFQVRLKAKQQDHPDLSMPSEWSEPYKSRITESGKALFETVGIPRYDNNARSEHYQRMYSFFGAPAVIFVTMGESLGQYSLFDCGSVTQTLCLAAQQEGLGTCILAAVVRHPDIIRAHVPLSPGKKIVIGVGIGYPDQSSAYNQYRSSRVPLSEMVLWSDI